MNARRRLRAVERLLSLRNGALRVLQRLLFGPTVAVPQRILLLRTAGLGDFILTLPALKAVRASFPGAHIALLTAASASSSIAAQVGRYAGNGVPWVGLAPGLIDQVLWWRPGGFRELRTRIRTLNPDTTFVLSDVGAPFFGAIKKLMFLRALGVRGAVHGLGSSATRALSKDAQFAAGRFEHHVMGPLRSVAEHPAVGRAESLPVVFPVRVPEPAREWAARLWNERGWHRARVVAVAPGSLQPHKRWPFERFASLCAALAMEPDVRLVAVGTVDDSALGDSLARRVPGLINLAGRTSVEQAAALFARCALVVGNDGGAMHLAAAAGARVVSIIPGIEFPGSIEPWGHAGLAVRHPVPCAPCYSFTHCPKGHGRCMKDLPEAAVLERCHRALASPVERTGTA